MVKIRLAQTGSKNRKTYRLVAIEEGKRRDGKTIEILGCYNPLLQPPQIKLKKERISYWLSQGAVPTESARKIIRL